MSSKKKFKHFKRREENEGFFKESAVSQINPGQSGKITIPIKGMHCRSCEILVGEKLEEIPSVKNAHVNYRKSLAEIYSNGPLDMAAVNAAVIDAGYEVGVDDSKAWISTDPQKYKDLAGAFALLIILYFVGRKFGLTDINIGGSGDNPSSLAVVLIVGLTAGISTCMALIGGLVLGISARFSEKHPEATSAQKFRPHIFFGLGRVISYFILGGAIGLAGKAFQLSGPSLGFLTIIVGFVMLALGAQLTEIFPRLSSGGLTLPSGVSKALGLKKHHEKEYSHGNAMLVGALTFFLPCGFTQAMQLYAISTGSFWSGALIMGTFALGTAPGLLGIGGLTSVIQGAFAKKFFKFAGLLVVFLAFFNISNGWNLTGWRLPSIQSASGPESTDSIGAREENGVQVVNMTQDSSGYSPNSFTVKKGVAVRWVIDSTDSRTCAASILFSKFNIRKALQLGENIIEFTPNEVGEFRFSCSMGMYRGVFKVVENTDKSSKNPSSTSFPDSPEPISLAPSRQPPKSSGRQEDVQVVKTTFFEAGYDDDSDIRPYEFTVKANQPVRFEVLAEVDGEGCMSTIMIPGLYNDPELLERGKTITMEFTPNKKGAYEITCAMGVPRGTLTVI